MRAVGMATLAAFAATAALADEIHPHHRYAAPRGVQGGGGTASGTVYYANTEAPYGYVWYLLEQPKDVLDDHSFTPGPAAGVGGTMDSIVVGWIELGPGPINFDIHMTWWDLVDTSNVNIPINQGVLGQYVLQVRNVLNPGAYQSIRSLAHLPGGGIHVPNDDFGLELRWFEPDSYTQVSDQGSPIFDYDHNGPSVGSNLDLGWSDGLGNFNGVYDPEDAFYAGGPPFYTALWFQCEGNPITRPCDPCDTNCDGSVNGQDIGGFIDILGGIPSSCSPCSGDANYNGTANGQDIGAFIECVAHEGCSCTCSLADGVVTPGGKVNVERKITNTSNKTCTYDWDIAKTSGTPTVTPKPKDGSVTLGPGATDTIKVEMSVPADTLAKDHATMKLTCTGCESTGVICVIPTGEDTASDGWDAGGVHKWKQTLTPVTADFSTRTVTERDPGGGGPDTCWFDGSAYAKFEAITGGTWTVEAGNIWKHDYVGWFGTAVTYYRGKGRAPCGTSFTQKMDINCPQGNTEYTSNTLKASFTATQVTSERDGQTATRNWP